MTSMTAPGVKIDKQTTLRLTSTKHYVEEDVSSILSGMSVSTTNSSPDRPGGEKKKGLLRKLQWRSPPANGGKRLPPSTSPLSQKLGAPRPGGKSRGGSRNRDRSNFSGRSGNSNVCVSGSDNISKICITGGIHPRENNCILVSSSDATVASQKSSHTKMSQGTTVSTKTLKHSNRGMGRIGTSGNTYNNCGASVSSSVNSGIPPLARLRKRVPLIVEEEQDFDEEESIAIYSQQSMTQNDDGQVVMFGSSITITRNYDQSRDTPGQSAGNSNNILGGDSIQQSESEGYCNRNTCSPTKYCNGKPDNSDSPTSVVLAQDDPFCGALASFENDESEDAESPGPPTSSSTPKRSSFNKRGVTLSTTKSGKTMETYIQGVDSSDGSSQIEKNNAAEYRNAMNRMRRLLTGAAEKDEMDQATKDEEDQVDNVNDSIDTSVFSGLISGHGNPPKESSNQDDDESTLQNTRQSGPIDVDTLSRHITPTERRHLRAMHKLGYYHLRRNEINQALNVFMEILRGQRERHGKRSLEVAMAMHNLGVVCVKGGRFDEGTRLCDGAARIRVEKLGKDHLDVAVSLAQQGVALMEIQEYATALASFCEALRIRRKALGSRHPLVIRLLNNIGCALFEMNNLDDSRLAFEEALDLQRELMRENSLGGKSLSCSDSCTGDGDTSEGGKDLELEENLEIDLREAHNMLLSIALTLCNLGSIHLRWKKYDDSLVFYEEALLIQESVLGEDHKVVVNTNESIEFVIRSKEENHQALLEAENDNDTTKIPSILNMDRMTNILLPRYEEGKKISDKVSNVIGALIDSVAMPDNNDAREGASGQFICGQPLMCVEEQSQVICRNQE